MLALFPCSLHTYSLNAFRASLRHAFERQAAVYVQAQGTLAQLDQADTPVAKRARREAEKACVQASPELLLTSLHREHANGLKTSFVGGLCPFDPCDPLTPVTVMMLTSLRTQVQRPVAAKLYHLYGKS